MWITFVLVESVLMIITSYKVISYRNETNRAVTLLARDSVIYFSIVFGCLVAILATSIRENFLVTFFKIPTQCISSIAVGRMMMNIRGLIMSDPEHTTHLRTLQFAAPANASSDSEIEEVA